MADLTGVIKQASPEIVIDAWYVSQREERTRLGLSEIGNSCMRYLWYVHQGFPKPATEGRILRLFELGDILETAIVTDLRSCGYRVHRQQEQVEFNDNETVLTGHIDGVIEGLIESSQPHLLEIKTASEKYFNDLKKKRSYELWNPKYKGQIHVYMLGAKLKRCLAVVYNKNTSEIYTERIKLDRDYAIRLLFDVFASIQQHDPPARLCPNASWFSAKWCPYYKECFKP